MPDCSRVRPSCLLRSSPRRGEQIRRAGAADRGDRVLPRLGQDQHLTDRPHEPGGKLYNCSPVTAELGDRTTSRHRSGPAYWASHARSASRRADGRQWWRSPLQRRPSGTRASAGNNPAAWSKTLVASAGFYRQHHDLCTVGDLIQHRADPQTDSPASCARRARTASTTLTRVHPSRTRPDAIAPPITPPPMTTTGTALAPPTSPGPGRQKLGDLHRVQRSALAQVVAADEHRQAATAGNRLVDPDAIPPGSDRHRPPVVAWALPAN